MKIERTKNSIRNLWWGYIYRLIAIILPFVFRTVIIRYLGMEYLGINSLFSAVLQVLNLSELGFGTAIVFNMYEPVANDDYMVIGGLLGYYKKIYQKVGITILLIGFTLIPIIPKLVNGTYPDTLNVYIVYFLFLLNTSSSYIFFSYRGSLLNAYQRNDIDDKVMICVTIIRFSVDIVILMVYGNYYIVLIFDILCTIIQNAIKHYITNRIYRNIVIVHNDKLIDKKKIYKNISALMCHKIGGIVLSSVDSIVISSYLGLIILAKYTNYFYIITAIEGVVAICFTGMTAGIGNSIITETDDKNIITFKRVLFFNAWLVGFICVCMISLYQDFIELWVGKQNQFGFSMVVLFVLYFFVHGIRRTIIAFRDAAGIWSYNKYQPIVSAMFNLTFNILLIHIMGLPGVILSSVCSMIIIDIPWETKAFCVKIPIKMKDYYWSIIKYFLVTCFTTVIVYSLNRLVSIHDTVVRIIIRAIICLFLTNALFIMIYCGNDEFVYLKNLMIRRFKQLQNRVDL